MSSDSLLSGLPGEVAVERITIGLAMTPTRSDVEGWTSPTDGLVVLPLERALGWDEVWLRRVLRHEIAHIRMRRFLNGSSVPRWLQEGLAEWVAGSLTCEGEFRLWIELRRRTAGHLSLPRLDDPWGGVPDRLAYDFFATFVDFLEVLQPGVVSSGRLLEELRSNDIESALVVSVGMKLADAEEAWWRYLRQRFRDEPACSG